VVHLKGVDVFDEVGGFCEHEERLKTLRKEPVVFDGFAGKETFAELIEGLVSKGFACQAEVAKLVNVEICRDNFD
jgi:hypothetical protein